MNGIDLLAEFRRTRAEAAFGELVRRYTNLVYSIAKRRVGSVTLAEEVAQIVFIRLSKAPPKLEAEAQLLAWLHRTTVHVSIDLWRSETRRRAREQHAVAMQTDRTEEAAWNEMTPVLDEALDELTEADRQVILLRFFDQKTMADLGRAFGVSEDAAKMRVSRAVERLRTQLGGAGVTCSAALLGALLSERSVEAAPKGLELLLAGIRLSAPTGFGGALGSFLLQTPKLKLLSGLAAALLFGGSALLLLHATWQGRSTGTRTGAPAGLAPESGPSDVILAAAKSESGNPGEMGDPDPVKLLQGVARARQRIASGIVDFGIFTRGNVNRPDATNRLQLKIQFEDGRCWAESIGQEYRYVTPIPGGPEAEAIVKRAGEMPREQAVREGLLEAFPSRHVVFYDGQAVTDYWETDSSHPSTSIDEPGRSSVFMFDPRCLGISTSFYVKNTVENCLAYQRAKTVTLAGKESIEGKPAWHVQVHHQDQSNHKWTSDLWIDALYPTRVLKVQVNGDIALSRFSDTDLKDPLPIEVRNIDYHNGVPRYETHVIRTSAHYDVPIDPACWTLDGLHMKVGTAVSDNRIHRRIGYWTGTGLSDDLPPKEKRQQTAPNRADLLALLEKDPATPEAFEAAQWILLNSPDGADVQKAADVILQAHIQSPELVKLTQELERMRHNCSSNLLQAMLDQNPHPEVRGNACLALAALRKDAAEYGQNKQATVEAEKLYERVIAEFAQVKQRGYSLAQLAEPQLWELRRLSIGKVAPEIDGCDLDGHPMKLSDYRGQVVALLFWSALSPIEHETREHRRLVEQMDGKPFALLGVHADDPTEKAKAAAEAHQMSWPSFQDARGGPISKTYNIDGWPTIYVLDRKGVIRYRGLHFRSEIAAAVDKLLQE